MGLPWRASTASPLPTTRAPNKTPDDRGPNTPNKSGCLWCQRLDQWMKRRPPKKPTCWKVRCWVGEFYQNIWKNCFWIKYPQCGCLLYLGGCFNPGCQWISSLIIFIVKGPTPTNSLSIATSGCTPTLCAKARIDQARWCAFFGKNVESNFWTLLGVEIEKSHPFYPFPSVLVLWSRTRSIDWPPTKRTTSKIVHIWKMRAESKRKGQGLY